MRNHDSRNHLPGFVRCARAASGHATAAPPSSGMNSRRLMSDIGLPPLWRCRSGLRLFRLDVCCFDYRPPLLNIVLVKCPYPFRCALLVRWDFQTQFGEQSAYLRMDESLDDRAVEHSDDVAARTFGSPQALPPRNVETGYTYLVHDRNIGGGEPAAAPRSRSACATAAARYTGTRRRRRSSRRRCGANTKSCRDQRGAQRHWGSVIRAGTR